MPVPNSSIYQPQQQAPYISTQPTQPPITHQAFNNASASAHAPSPPHPSAHSPLLRPASNTPQFHTIMRGGYTPTDLATPARSMTMPVPSLPGQHHNVSESNVIHPTPHLGMHWPQLDGSQLVTGDPERRAYISTALTQM